MIKEKSPTLSELDYRGAVDDLAALDERFAVMKKFFTSIPYMRRTVDGDYIHFSGIYTQKRSYALRGKIRDLFHPVAEANLIKEVMAAEHISAPQSIMSGHSGSPIPSDDYIVTSVEREPLFCLQCYHFGLSFDSPFWLIVDQSVLKSLKLKTRF